MLFIKIINDNGPITEPYGTPNSTKKGNFSKIHKSPADQMFRICELDLTAHLNLLKMVNV